MNEKAVEIYMYGGFSGGNSYSNEGGQNKIRVLGSIAWLPLSHQPALIENRTAVMI